MENGKAITINKHLGKMLTALSINGGAEEDDNARLCEEQDQQQLQFKRPQNYVYMEHFHRKTACISPNLFWKLA